MSGGSSKIESPSSKEAPSPKPQSEATDSSERAWWEVDDDDLVVRETPNGDGYYANDLEERLTVFGEDVIELAKKLPKAAENNRIKDQLVGAGTSIGANYCEATESVSKKDFRFSISRCKKEAKETRFFIRMLVASAPELANTARPLYREATELMLIFASMYRK